MNARRFITALARGAAGALFLAVFLLSFGPVQAAGTWYVAPGGRDSNTCTAKTTPCATIGGVLNKTGFVAGNTINVAAGTYTGTGDQVVLFNKSAKLNGGWDATFVSQSGLSVLDGGGARRVMYINANVAVNMNRFTIQHGAAVEWGGGIYNNGRLTFSDGQFLNNLVPRGGSPAYGGGVYSKGGAVTIERTTATGNEGQDGSFIATNGTAVVLNQLDVYGNPADGEALQFLSGTFQITNSKLHNHSNPVIYASLSRGYLTNSSIYDNTGSAILCDRTPLDVNGAAINNNQQGGLVMQDSSLLAIANSAVTNNHSLRGGGIDLFETGAVISNSTISGNRADAEGGGIRMSASALTVRIYNTTISGNTAQTGGGIYNGASLTLHNSLVAGNSANEGKDCSGIVVSAGYSLVGDRSGCTYTSGPGDITLAPGTSARLGDLEGSPAYVPLLAGSPAIDSGNPTGCKDNTGTLLAADQRGKPRFGVCDIGAYELQPFGFSTIQPDLQTASPGAKVNFTIQLQNQGVVAITSVQVTNSLPGSLQYVEGSLTATRGQPVYQNGNITWNGALSAKDRVTIHYSATVSPTAPLHQFITNPVIIQGGGETFPRSAVVQVEPYLLYCPILGKPCPPLYTDDFNDPASGWPVGNNEDYLLEYLNGEYQILVHHTFRRVIVRSSIQESNFAEYVDVRNPNNVAGRYGLAFGISQDQSSYYTFVIYPDGWYAVIRYDMRTPVVLAEAFSPAIHPGSASNRLKVERNGGTINVYANGELLTNLTDNTYTTSLYIGLVAVSSDPANLDVRFDNFVVYPTTCTNLPY